jgi:hypothetical protein
MHFFPQLARHGRVACNCGTERDLAGRARRKTLAKTPEDEKVTSGVDGSMPLTRIGRLIGSVAIGSVLAAPVPAPAANPAPAPHAITSTTASSLSIYANDFQQPAGPEWSSGSRDVTPKGKRRFLGQFGGEQVTLHLAHLPAHRFLRLRFDLYVINPVDGSSAVWGPDVWDLTVENGPTLLHTTFDNCGFFSDNNEQAFPDEFPCKPHPGWTGAVEKQTLGYIASWGGPDRTFGVDSVYRFDLLFPHRGDDVTFDFTSFSTEDKKGESWGLANVKVDAQGAGERLARGQFEHVWKDLGSEDPVVAFAAKWKLIAAADDAEALLAKRLEVQAVDSSQITALIEQLSAADPAARERATRDLLAMSDRILPTLLKQLGNASPEAESRMTRVVRTLSDPTSDRFDALRRARAFHALEVMRGQCNPVRRTGLSLPQGGRSGRTP